MKLFGRRYINLIKEFSLAGFKIKDQRSGLGFLWSFLNPLIMTSILFFLFKNNSALIKNPHKNYFLYILIGTVTWNFFVMATNAGLASIIGKADVVRNISFPKEILPYSEIGTFSIQYFFELLTVLFFIALFGVGFSMHIILLPLIIIIEILLITGLSLFLACICVYTRDLIHIWNVVTRMLFFMVPVFYAIPNISPRLRWIVTINPVSQIMIFSRDILLYHRAPSLHNIFLVTIFCLFILISGHLFFKHNEYKIVERV